jgi:hypothetical protein
VGYIVHHKKENSCEKKANVPEFDVTSKSSRAFFQEVYTLSNLFVFSVGT